MSEFRPGDKYGAGADPIGGKRRRFKFAGAFFILGVICGLCAMFWPYTHAQIFWRYAAFIFGGLFVLFLVFGLMGRQSGSGGA
jgi:hypothetical protein